MLVVERQEKNSLKAEQQTTAAEIEITKDEATAAAAVAAATGDVVSCCRPTSAHDKMMDKYGNKNRHQMNIKDY